MLVCGLFPCQEAVVPALSRSRAAVVVALVLSAGGGAAVASIPSSDGLISGCYSTKDGGLRVIDAASQSCGKGEAAISWNRTGPAGPPGPSGLLASLDAVEGIPCSGDSGRPGRTHLAYGTTTGIGGNGPGFETPVSISCVTTLVGNPGTVTATVTDGTLQLGLLSPIAIPSGWTVTGTVEHSGIVDTSSGPVTFTGLPWSASATGITATGTVTLTLDPRGGFIDPASGEAWLTVAAYASVHVDADIALYGSVSTTCSLATAASPMVVTLKTSTLGTAYSTTDGTLALGSAIHTPALSNCNPPLPGVSDIANLVLSLVAGDGSLRLEGHLEPILVAP